MVSLIELGTGVLPLDTLHFFYCPFMMLTLAVGDTNVTDALIPVLCVGDVRNQPGKAALVHRTDGDVLYDHMLIPFSPFL